MNKDTKPNKTDAGNGLYGICRVIEASRSPSPAPSRFALPVFDSNLESVYDLWA